MLDCSTSRQRQRDIVIRARMHGAIVRGSHVAHIVHRARARDRPGGIGERIGVCVAYAPNITEKSLSSASAKPANKTASSLICAGWNVGLPKEFPVGDTGAEDEYPDVRVEDRGLETYLCGVACAVDWVDEGFAWGELEGSYVRQRKQWISV